MNEITFSSTEVEQQSEALCENQYLVDAQFQIT